MNTIAIDKRTNTSELITKANAIAQIASDNLALALEIDSIENEIAISKYGEDLVINGVDAVGEIARLTEMIADNNTSIKDYASEIDYLATFTPYVTR